MKPINKILWIVLTTSLTLCSFGCNSPWLNPNNGTYVNPNNVQVFFSPKGGCTEATVDAINHAEKIILMQAYSFTSEPIANALLNAKKRGVEVSILLDKSQKREKYCPAEFLQASGISILTDCQHRIAHNKILIIDNNKIITGSFNFTKSGESGNAENLVILSNVPELATIYSKNWKLHMNHSELFDYTTKTIEDDPQAETMRGDQRKHHRGK